MHDSQAPAANPTNITAQPSPEIAADEHILPSTLNEAIRERRPSRLYAVVMGIDNYSSLNKLAGAVNDAKAMAEFLKSHLNVPADRIQLLLDASRKEIIDAFRQLSEEDKVETDDPILIYYAGHGAQLEAPHGWEAGGPGRKIQAICPRDYQKGSVPAIPDRTIGAFLDLIGEKKGNNITVIFDCCYSASGTRMEIPTAQDVRGVVLDDELSLDLDQPEELSPLIGRSSQIATRSGVRGLGSHVLVAACKEEETAKEDNGRGRFTVALLELFKQGGRMETLTYTDILKDIRPIQGQNPQVEGIHRDRIIFNAKAAPHHSFYSVRFNAGDRTFIVDAGSLHGVTTGSEFTVYKDRDSFLQSSVWGVLRVFEVKLASSVLRVKETPGIDLVKPGIALLSAGGANQALAITASYDQQLLPAFHQAIQSWESQGIISVVDENAAVVKLRLENGHIVFDILDTAVKACGLDQLYYSAKLTDTEHVASILSAGRNFFWWYLMRGPHHPIVDALKVEFMELKESQDTFDDTEYNIRSPKGENLLQDGAIDVYVSSVAKPYGIKLTNNSKWDLFPAVFYFDHSDWSIVEYYCPGTSGQFAPEPPLRKQGGTLTIGYGPGSHDAMSFQLIGEKHGEKQNFDVGHLKLFFTTDPADLNHIQQESPFTATRGTYKFKQVLNTWVTLQYPIIQRRA